jgi:hypothetical protein
MGDSALFISGFFADSLADKVADLRYYRALGGMAYERLSRDHEHDRAIGPPVFTELAARFREFADVLAEVSEASRMQTPLSVLKLYERWVRTGSRRAAALLARQGIAPGPLDDGTIH